MFPFRHKKPERHTTFHELWEAFAVDQCPICCLRERSAADALANLYYEAVNDPATAAGLEASLGFSPETVRRVAKGLDAHGTSIIYGRNCRSVAAKLMHTPDSALRPQQADPVLQQAAATEMRYCRVFASHCDEADFQQHHAANLGLCLHHLDQVLALITDKNRRLALLRIEHTLLLNLAAELELFVKRNSYQNTDPIGAEKNAWLRALRKFNRPEPSPPSR